MSLNTRFVLFRHLSQSFFAVSTIVSLPRRPVLIPFGNCVRPYPDVNENRLIQIRILKSIRKSNRMQYRLDLNNHEQSTQYNKVSQQRGVGRRKTEQVHNAY